MAIRSLTTYRSPRYPHLLWVEVEDHDGRVGLGETYYWPEACEAYVHEAIAPVVVGTDARNRERLVKLFLRNRINSGRMSAETRAFSAVEIALTDLFAKSLDVPLHDLAGGRTRDSIRIYNSGGQAHVVDGINDYVRPLFEQGITAFKITPFHPYVAKTAGQSIGLADLKAGCRAFESLRREFGDKIDLMLEMGCRWEHLAAREICRAVDQFDLMWIEDPIVQDSVEALADLKARSSTAFCVSEYVATINGARPYFEAGVVDIMMVDVCWMGGVAESCKAAAVAQSHRRAVTMHDFTGPIAYAAGVHLSLACENAVIQETSHDFYAGWYGEVLTALPTIENGFATPPEGAGLGTALRAEFKSDPATIKRTSTSSDARTRWTVMDVLGRTYLDSNRIYEAG